MENPKEDATGDGGGPSSQPPEPKHSYAQSLGIKATAFGICPNKDFRMDHVPIEKNFSSYQGGPALFFSSEEIERSACPFKFALITKCLEEKPEEGKREDRDWSNMIIAIVEQELVQPNERSNQAEEDKEGSPFSLADSDQFLNPLNILVPSSSNMRVDSLEKTNSGGGDLEYQGIDFDRDNGLWLPHLSIKDGTAVTKPKLTGVPSKPTSTASTHPSLVRNSVLLHTMSTVLTAVAIYGSMGIGKISFRSNF
ncbi:hypothetical protein HHK36_027538 [Tetracentron sinense]|uniref:Uncharacterized protein n=1 Tax=Tetracentron sinense TaxID=13715 RepID=A0A835D4I3_TETSI|nr:hypothetical protein HHK36_027538 [Tetracentron sinense]